MRRTLKPLIFFLLMTFMSPRCSLASAISPEMEALFQQSEDAEHSVIVSFSGKADLSSVEGATRRDRRASIIRALRGRAESSQGPSLEFLSARGARRARSLWIVNAMAVTASADVLRRLASMPGVESIRPDEVINAPVVTVSPMAAAEWNIEAVNAPDLWALGYIGQGVVVANMDTGVDATHPDLADNCRGGASAGECGANSWYDPNGEHAEPYDADGHGTQTMGIAVGGSASGTAIGVAPGAEWIAVKIFNDAGAATTSGIHDGFQWLLDPDGDPGTDDAPDVVNNSWGYEAAAGQCLTEFQTDIEVLKAAGIAVVFSAGNDGPGSSTDTSPANNAGSFGVGAVRDGLTVAPFSSRGPSACDGRTFPDVVAPGMGVMTSDNSDIQPYTTVDGTSFASPHVAGAIALLLSAYPDMTVSGLESLLMQTATDLGDAGADNNYGSGLINVMGAYLLLGTSTRLGLFRNGTWYLDNGDRTWNSSEDAAVSFGRYSGDVPVVGDWDGDGTDQMGLFRNGTWYLDNGDGTWNSAEDTAVSFGRYSGDVPVVGDWDGDGTDQIGLFRNGAWYLDNGDRTWNSAEDTAVSFGRYSGDVPVVGDWDGDGTDQMGLFRNGAWYLDNGDYTWNSAEDTTVSFGRYSGDVPVVGDWDGGGTDQIGLFRNGTWYLDNGDYTWNSAEDATVSFGRYSGDKPLTGRW